MKIGTSLFYLPLLLTAISMPACKKDGTGSGTVKPATLEVEIAPSSTVYGNVYTFRVMFEELADEEEVMEYGVVYKAWVGDATEKEPIVGDNESTKLPFGAWVPPAGTVAKLKAELSYESFNDANYRAYASLKDGTIVYGKTLYYVSV